MNKKTIQSVFLGMVLLLMYLPILLLAVYSFMDSAIIGRSSGSAFLTCHSLAVILLLSMKPLFSLSFSLRFS